MLFICRFRVRNLLLFFLSLFLLLSFVSSALRFPPSAILPVSVSACEMKKRKKWEKNIATFEKLCGSPRRVTKEKFLDVYSNRKKGLTRFIYTNAYRSSEFIKTRTI